MHACMLSRFSCVRLCVTPWTIAPPGSSVYGDSSGKTTRVGCHALLQGIFPSQRSNLLCLLHGQVGSLPLAPAGKPPHLHTYSQLSAVADEYYSCLQCFPLPSPCFVHSSRAKSSLVHLHEVFSGFLGYITSHFITFIPSFIHLALITKYLLCYYVSETTTIPTDTTTVSPVWETSTKQLDTRISIVYNCVIRGKQGAKST